MALTNSKLKALHGKEREKRQEFPDRDGLNLVAGLSGKLSFVLRYRHEGKSKRYTIGSYPAFDLNDAREEANKIRKIIESGEDPKRQKESKKRPYIEDCAKVWLENYVSHLKPTTQKQYQSQANKYFNNDRLTVDVEKARFEEWIAYFDKIAEDSSRKAAGSILKTIKSMLRFCRSRSFISGSVVFDIELKAVGEKPTVGQRHLELHEAAKLWIEIGRTKATPAIKNCIKLLLIFGARNSEIRQAERKEFDLQRRIWTLPAERSKTGKVIRRAIPDLAAQLIIELDETYGNKGLLIPGANNNTSMTTHSVARMCKRLWGKLHIEHGIEEFTVHDFRRTLSTRLSEKAVLPHVTEKMLGHELRGVMSVYNKHDWIDEQAKAYQLWCSTIQSAVIEELSRV